MIGKYASLVTLLFLSKLGLADGENGEDNWRELIRAVPPTIEWDLDDDVDVQEARAGLVGTLTANYFADYNKRLMSSITEKMKGIEMQAYCSSNAVGELFTTNLCLSKQLISNYIVREEDSKLEIDAERKGLHLRVSGISLDFGFDFRLWSEPKWLHDSGKGSISATGTDISILLNLLKDDDNGRLRVSYSDVKIHTKDYSVKLDGENDISRATEMMLKNFKVFFEEELTTLLASRLATVAEEALNERVLNHSILLSEPTYSPDYIAFIMDGAYDTLSQYPNMPVHLTDGTERVHSEQFVSQMTLNSALSALHEDGSLVVVRQVESDFIKQFIPNFENVYGKHTEVSVTLEAEEAPVLLITEKGSTITADVKISFLNPFGSDYEAVLMHGTASSDVIFELLPDFTLVADFENTEVILDEFKAYFYCEATLEDLDASMAPLTELFADAISTRFLTGEGGLKLAKPVVDEMSSTRLFTYEGFLMVQTVAKQTE